MSAPAKLRVLPSGIFRVGAGERLQVRADEAARDERLTAFHKALDEARRDSERALQTATVLVLETRARGLAKRSQ